METKNGLFIVLIDGPMGSGKTTTSKALNAKLEGTARISLADVKRFISGYEKSESYTKISQEVIKVMTEKYLELGISVVVECIMKAEGVESFAQIAKKYNAHCFAYKLTAPESLLFDRVKERTRLMMDVAELPSEKITELEGLFEPNYKFHMENPCSAAKTVDSENFNTDQIIEMISSDIRTSTN